MRKSIILPVAAALAACLPAAANELPDAIAVAGEVPVATVNAIGAQIYECKPDVSGRLAWQFREPIATLFAGGKTVGRHYAGPNWEMTDGSAVAARVTGRARGASESDIPLLKLEVMSRKGAGQLAGVTTIQRLNTTGGVAEGACDAAGTLLNVPYIADYAFYRKASVAAPVQSRPVAAAVRAPVVAPLPVAAPVTVIVLPHDKPGRPRPKKKNDQGKGPEPRPKGPMAEPKPAPGGPKVPPVVESTPNPKPGTNAPAEPKPSPTAEPKPGTNAPSTPPTKVVRDNRGGTTGGGVSVTERESDRPRIKVRDHRSSNTPSSGPSVPPKKTSATGGTVCGIAGTPPCNVQ